MKLYLDFRFELKIKYNLIKLIKYMKINNIL